jgi:hypothetical protein
MNNFDDIISTPAQEPQHDDGFNKSDYAAKKRAERDGVFELSDKTATEISTDIGKFHKYLDVQSNFSRYSTVNAMLILAQKPDARQIGSFDHWKDRGGFIKSRQAGFVILEPQEYTKEDGTPGVGYNAKKMFDISQVDTRKMRSDPPSPTYSDRQLLGALASKSPVPISGVDELPQTVPSDLRSSYGGGTSQKGEIYIRKGMGFNETFTAMAVELAYSEITYSQPDSVNARFSAFCSAYMLGKKYGIDVSSFNFSDAPAHFSQISDLEPQTVKSELSVMRDAMDTISARMERHLDNLLQKSAKSQEAR